MKEEQKKKKDHIGQHETTETESDDNINNKKGLKILFLSSDTGGGHRASAESLASQFLNLYPSSTYTLLDILSDHAPLPYNYSVSSYQHLSSNPTQWKVVYNVTNTWPIKGMASLHLKIWSEKGVRESIQNYNPDVVVSVHPLMTNVPVISCAKISAETNKHIPIFTVVTDLGNGHAYWFDAGVEKMYVASDSMKSLAMKMGGVEENKIVKSGLPIREEFGMHVDKMKQWCDIDNGDDDSNKILSEKDKKVGYQTSVRNELGLVLPQEAGAQRKHRIVMVMGGGEGVGSLSSIVKSIYVHFVKRYSYRQYKKSSSSSSDIDYDMTILVICGRNEKLQKQLQNEINWDKMKQQAQNQVIQEEERKKKTMETIQGIQHFLLDKAKMLPPLNNNDSKNKDGREDNEEKRSGREQNHDSQEDGSTVSKSSDGSNTPTTQSSSAAPMNTSRELTDEKRTLDKESVDSKNEHVGDTLTSTTFSNDHLGKQQIEQNIGDTSDATLSSSASPSSSTPSPPIITVRPLGYTTNIASYMVSSDILLTKAGPGTIAEAASLGLPILLTSYLPGQEEGNVDFVMKNNFGDYVSDSNCDRVANTLLDWLENDEKMESMSREAKRVGKPYAARDIVKEIGRSAWRWKELNGEEEEESEETAKGNATTLTQPENETKEKTKNDDKQMNERENTVKWV